MSGWKVWTPDEDARLREFYAVDTPAEDIAAALGRSIGSVRNRAFRLGLTDVERTRRASRIRMTEQARNPEFKRSFMSAGGKASQRVFAERRKAKPVLTPELVTYRRKLLRHGLTPAEADREIEKLVAASAIKGETK